MIKPLLLNSAVAKHCDLSVPRRLIFKQLLDEVVHNSENYQGRGLCYLAKPKAEANTTNRGFNNSRYHVKTESNNCFIRHFKC